MKQTVIQCITAILCVIAVAVTSVTSISKISDATIEAAKNAPQTQASANTDDPAIADPTADPSADPATADPSADPAAADPTADPAATADPSADPAAADPAASADTSAATGKTNASTPAAKSGTTAPSSKADIATYYNNALNKVISSKAGYTKARTTNLGKLEGAEAIMKFQAAADAVNSFLGVGTTNFTNKKGEAKYLSKASLTEKDISSATCTGTDVYTITINLVNGNSAMPGNTDTSPLKRSGLYVGTGDKSEYDYKNAENIYSGLNNSGDASVQAVRETTKNAKIVATVDAKTGNMKTLKVTFDWEAGLTDVKYIVTLKGEKTGYADTTVAINAFQF